MEVSARSGKEVRNQVSSTGLRRGPWTLEEDVKLVNSIATQGEGRWNLLARNAGLNRTGKSCRLRWLNYLRPDVRRGNITLEEQLLILELHSRFGNRWSKIAQYLRGRTDNEIKNYWRTRVQKHAKQLKCDVNSKQFRDTMKNLWMPRLIERIQAGSVADIPNTSKLNEIQANRLDLDLPSQKSVFLNKSNNYNPCSSDYTPCFLPQSNYYNSTATALDSSTMQVSTTSDLTTDHRSMPTGGPLKDVEAHYTQFPESNFGESSFSYNPFPNVDNCSNGIDFPGVGDSDSWFDGEDASAAVWNNEFAHWFLT